MKVLLITDTHYGVKQNSITWLNSQLDFIYKQFIPYIKNINDDVMIIHLGDVFDSRSSISPFVAAKVKQMFIDITDIDNVKEINVIAGNHDFYSPNSDEVDSISLILSNINKLKIINKEMMYYPSLNALLVPWYQWFEQDKLQEYINKIGVKYIFTHADIVTEQVKIRGAKIYSGHVHTPSLNPTKGLYNLGSCYSLNFADANQERMFYEFNQDTGDLTPIVNNISIKFWRLYNDEIFDNLYNIKENDYIELYITQQNMTNQLYTNKINEFTKNYKNIWIIPQANTILEGIDESKFEKYDIESIAKELIPEEVKDKFNIILNQLKQ